MPGVFLLQPAQAILQNADGIALAVNNGIDIPAYTSGLLSMVSDGIKSYYAKGDSSGRLEVIGAGVAGTPAGGVLTIQGVVGGTPLTMNQGTANTAANGWPVKLTDGTTVAGVDNAGALYVSGKSAVGVAPSSNPLYISGIDGGGLKRDFLIKNTAPLTSDYGLVVRMVGGATGSDVNVAGWFGSTAPTVGQKTAAASIPVTMASDQTLTVVVQGADAPRRGFIRGIIVLSATTIVPVEQTTYTEQTANAQRSLVSTSASDAAAGTGARTVNITYFTATLTGPFTETVTLNGTTPVNTVASDICFIEKMEVLTVGTSGAAVGTINLKAATGGGGVTIWSIAATYTLTNGAHHYVPAGATHYVTGCTVGIKGADSAGYALRAKNPLNANDTDQYISSWVRTATNSSFTRSFYTPIDLVGPMRVTAWAWPDSTSNRTYFVEYDYYEE
jgi:hypothetical protein